MNTSAAQLRLVDLDPEKSKLPDGSSRLLGSTRQFSFKIVPDKSVSFFISEVTQEVADIVDLYVGDLARTMALLKRVAAFVSSQPNTEFKEPIGDGLVLTCMKIAAGDRAALHLSICEASES